MQRRSLVLVVFVVLASVTDRSLADLGRPSQSLYVAPEGRALVVFDRPRKRLSEEVVFSIVDHRGRCIGILGNGWKVVAELRPGAQKLLVITGVAQPQVQLLEVKAEAGRTYVVRMQPRVKAKAPVEITVIRRKEQPLEAFPASVVESSPFRPDVAECAAWVAKRRGKLEAKASAARQEWNANEALRAKQTVQRSDGWTAEEVRAVLDPRAP